MRGRIDRLNFGGVHKFGKTHHRTGLTLHFNGYSEILNKITDLSGGFCLLDPHGKEAAVWHFVNLIEHWNRKHAKAVYVPVKCNKIASRQYSFGHTVRLCESTDFLLFLQAIAAGAIAYDPGIKIEDQSSLRPRLKKRSQFRIKSKGVERLYAQTEIVSVVAK
jgi:hypothetical protein